MSVTTVTVTGTYLLETGAPASGTVEFLLSAPLLDTVSKRIYAPQTVVATLNGTGSFSVALPATNDPTSTPTGLTYTVTERVGGQTYGSVPRVYSVVLDRATPTVDLSTLAPATNTVLTYYLNRTSNLSDLASPSAALANLGAAPLGAPAWATGVAYVVGQAVMSPSNEPVVCLVAHTSGTYATDQAAGKWQQNSATFSKLPTAKQAGGTLSDVQAIPNLRWCFTPETGFYSDQAGTILQATDGGSVKCWKDAGPNADHATTATAGLTLKQGAGSGCDGLNIAASAVRLVTTGGFDASFDAGMTTFVVVSDPTVSANRVTHSDTSTRYYHSWNGSTNQLGFVMAAASAAPPTPNVPADLPTNANTSAATGAVAVECLRYNGPSTKSDYFLHGYAMQQPIVGSASTLSLTGPLNIGGLTGGGFQWGGNILALVIFNRALTNAEVQVVTNYLSAITRARSKPVVHMIGNSLFAGTNASRTAPLGNSGLSSSATHGATDVPSQLLDLYPSDDVMVRSDAYGGRTLTQMLAETPRTVQTFYDPAAHAQRVAVVWELSNEILQSDASTAYTKLVSLCTTLRNQGWLVLALTCMPRSDSNPPLFLRQYQVVNNRIRANWQTFANGLVDIAADPRLGLPGAEQNLTYFASDKVHLTDEGYRIVAGKIKAALDTIIPSGTARRYLSKSVAGAANVTLKPVEAGTVTLPGGNGVVMLTGALTANIQVVLPLTAGAQALFHNNTTGAFTVTLIGATGTGYTITQGKKALAYTDGVNWYQSTPEV